MMYWTVDWRIAKQFAIKSVAVCARIYWATGIKDYQNALKKGQFTQRLWDRNVRITTEDVKSFFALVDHDIPAFRSFAGFNYFGIFPNRQHKNAGCNYCALLICSTELIDWRATVFWRILCPSKQLRLQLNSCVLGAF